jgi:hypothetical protein
MEITTGQSHGKHYSVWGKFDQFHAGRAEQRAKYAVDCMEHGRVSVQNSYSENTAAVLSPASADTLNGTETLPTPRRGFSRQTQKRTSPTNQTGAL